MKSSSVEKAFADPQSLAVTAKVAAGLKDQLQKTPLQVEQRQQQLKRVLVDSDLFANNSTRTTAPLSSISGSISASASTSAPKNNDGNPVHSVVQVFDHNFGAGLDFLLTWTLWLQAKEDNQQLQGLNYVAEGDFRGGWHGCKVTSTVYKQKMRLELKHCPGTQESQPSSLRLDCFSPGLPRTGEIAHRGSH